MTVITVKVARPQVKTDETGHNEYHTVCCGISVKE
jgi:hypothetical protein